MSNEGGLQVPVHTLHLLNVKTKSVGMEPKIRPLYKRKLLILVQVKIQPFLNKKRLIFCK